MSVTPTLDADPGVPITDLVGTRRALGRDPFATDGTDAEPWLDALDRFRARTEPAVPLRSEERSDLLLGLLPADVASRLDVVTHRLDAEPDPFGMTADGLRSALPVFWAIHEAWFRVTSQGVDRIPSEGPAILVANHGGLLPFDGAMLATHVLLRLAVPRVVRPLVPRFVQEIGPLDRFYRRTGSVTARRDEFRRLLERGELVLVFPEGVEGITKPLPARYRLQHFHPGFAEEAIRAQVPIVPIAIAGPDDQAPLLADVKPLAKLLGLPAFPITPTFPLLGPLGLLPYPVRYRIDVGRPFVEPSPRPPADPARRAVAVASRVRGEIQRRLTRLRDVPRLA